MLWHGQGQSSLRREGQWEVCACCSLARSPPSTILLVPLPGANSCRAEAFVLSPASSYWWHGDRWFLSNLNTCFAEPELCLPPPTFIPSCCAFGWWWDEWTSLSLARSRAWELWLWAKSQRFTACSLLVAVVVSSLVLEWRLPQGAVQSCAGSRLSICWDFLKAFVSFPSTSESLSCGTPASIGAKAWTTHSGSWLSSCVGLDFFFPFFFVFVFVFALFCFAFNLK